MLHNFSCYDESEFSYLIQLSVCIAIEWEQLEIFPSKMKVQFLILVTVFSTKGSVIDSPYSVDLSTMKSPLQNAVQPTMVSDSTEELDKISQCTYDYKGLRLNNGCLVNSEEPLICTRGELVLKTFDDGNDMCCCNYSRLDKNRKNH